MRRNEIDVRLIKSLQEGSCVPFLGAGITSLPGHKLAEVLIRKFSIKNMSVNQYDLEEISQYISRVYSRKALIKVIKSEIRKLKPTEEHSLIAELILNSGVRHICTTNYDLFLEGLIRKIEPDIHIAISSKESQFLHSFQFSDSDIIIYKLHGSINDPAEDILITKNDLDTGQYMRNRPSAVRLIENFISEDFSFLFIGYGLNDPNIVSLIYEIMKKVNAKKLLGWAVIGKGQESQKKKLIRIKEKNIMPICEDASVFLDKIKTPDSLVKELEKMTGIELLKRSLIPYLHSIVHSQGPNGDWYDDIINSAYIGCALKRLGFTNWNMSKLVQLLRKKYLECEWMNEQQLREEYELYLNFPIEEHDELNRFWFRKLPKKKFRWENVANLVYTCFILPMLEELEVLSKRELQSLERIFWIAFADRQIGSNTKYPWVAARFLINLHSKILTPRNVSVVRNAQSLLISQHLGDHWESPDSFLNPPEEVTAMCIVGLTLTQKYQQEDFGSLVEESTRWLWKRTRRAFKEDGKWIDAHRLCHIAEACLVAKRPDWFEKIIRKIIDEINKWHKPIDQDHGLGDILIMSSKFLLLNS